MQNPVHALIVDDDTLNTEVLERMLDTEGIACTTLNDPALLNAVLDTASTIDLVFLDLEMPHLDGFDALRLLRKRLGASVRVIAYTVHTSERHRALELGFDGLVGKPLSMARFPDQLRRILSGQPVWET